jgi:DNA-directed RNA polymerase subunit H (RpoH/RPB5)
MSKDIEAAVKKAKDLVEKMKLDEPYKSLTYSKLLERFLIVENSEEQIILKKENLASNDIPQIKTQNNYRKAIVELLSTNWGNTPRTSGEIKEALELNTIHVPNKSISATLIQLVKNLTLRRLKKGKLFAYVLAKRE